MPDSVLRTVPIWVFGKKVDFKIYKNSVVLDEQNYSGTAANPTTAQKNQIVMHWTGGQGSAQAVVNWWNTMVNLPNWICPNYFKKGAAKCTQHRATRWVCPTPGCTKTSSNNNWHCPTHGSRNGNCPIGHGPMKRGKKSASSQYVLELSGARADAGNPYADVVELLDSNAVAWHAGVVNTNSIGIETSNLGHGVFSSINVDEYQGAGSAKRPKDRNRWLKMGQQVGVVPANGKYQALQEEQILTYILFFRYLCIKHRIPRLFLGYTVEEAFTRFWHGPAAGRNLRRSRLFRFRGIFGHLNCHETKLCGGPVFPRNRLYRGITDEWWLPIQLDGKERTYYMGPFDPQFDQASFVRWEGGSEPAAHLFEETGATTDNFNALHDTKSYFDLAKLDYYYALTETSVHGGQFPISANKLWHGGVHLVPAPGDRKVYAAAGGTIVAARLGGDATVEADRNYGSQRFVLIRHAVYLEQEDDPGGGRHIKYALDDANFKPKYVFSLYMHLKAFASSLTAADLKNPPWFNFWLRHNKHDGDDPEQVFCPNVEVSVGDWIGECGNFFGYPRLHFEIISKEEFTDQAPYYAPFNGDVSDANPNDENCIADTNKINQLVQDRLGNGIDIADILASSYRLRNVRSKHKSEWALNGPEALAPVLHSEAARAAKWDKLRHFMWVKDALTKCPDLKDQLCDEKGFMWHYHPVTFMGHVNSIIQEDTQETVESTHSDTNVITDNGYLTTYVDYLVGAPTPAAADNEKIEPYAIGRNSLEYHFNRAELACRIHGAHDLTEQPPKRTRFHQTLLDVLEDIRVQFGKSLTVTLSHVCSTHNVAANHGRCVLNSSAAFGAHNKGHAIDIKPANATPQYCKKLWDTAQSVTNTYTSILEDEGGGGSRPNLADGFSEITASTSQAINDKLVAGTALTPAEAHAFVLHLELEEEDVRVVWECWLRKPSHALSVEVAQGGVLGKYTTEADATADSAQIRGTTTSHEVEAWLLPGGSNVLNVKRSTEGLIAVFATREEADAAATVDGHAWPKLG